MDGGHSCLDYLARPEQILAHRPHRAKWKAAHDIGLDRSTDRMEIEKHTTLLDVHRLIGAPLVHSLYRASWRATGIELAIVSTEMVGVRIRKHPTGNSCDRRIGVKIGQEWRQPLVVAGEATTVEEDEDIAGGVVDEEVPSEAMVELGRVDGDHRPAEFFEDRDRVVARSGVDADDLELCCGILVEEARHDLEQCLAGVHQGHQHRDPMLASSSL